MVLIYIPVWFYKHCKLKQVKIQYITYSVDDVLLYQNNKPVQQIALEIKLNQIDFSEGGNYCQPTAALFASTESVPANNTWVARREFLGFYKQSTNTSIR